MTTLAGRLGTSVTWQESVSSGKAVRAAVAVGRERSATLAQLVGARGHSTEVVFSGAGSSFYLAQTAASAYRSMLGRPAVAIPPSELLLRPAAALGDPAVQDRPLVAVSRSGSTSEIVRLLEAARTEGRRTLGITCRADSPLAELADDILNSPDGDERSIVMTRSFTSMLAMVLRAIAGVAVGAERSNADRIAADLDGLADRWSSTRDARDRALLLASEPWKRVVVLGGGAGLGLANEACLKLTEMTQVAANAWEPYEFRHGPISVCEPGVLVVGLLGGDGADAERAVLGEAEALGATVWALDEETVGGGLHPLARLPLLLVPIQALAIGHAFARGLDPDHPRHLTQVVRLAH